MLHDQRHLEQTTPELESRSSLLLHIPNHVGTTSRYNAPTQPAAKQYEQVCVPNNILVVDRCAENYRTCPSIILLLRSSYIRVRMFE